MQVHQNLPADQTTEALEETAAAQTRRDENDYLREILTARVYDVARETELERAPNLSARLRNPVFLKR
ncbi:threonine dehydratase, partial [Paraburkholderia lycopersici]